MLRSSLSAPLNLMENTYISTTMYYSLSKQQRNEIMAPALHQTLPAMGVYRHFPRHVVHRPLSHMGLEIRISIPYRKSQE